ncbi:NtaA/DmoA family FMN-dependent monooxygenase [Verticiella sediminum]|uniref:NtaA/DmoA family FMN-dependent monooxygenase n=1 Tax=Verticiella sediminum TaxID=1247510 RepID=A0A556AIR3_9BURK|nr:NtaA/DmoA family FMN-dependent monooxygenase [Verticiella sediminum]TSH92792.1 NtaA/DmoA family FMN-dependent monooxygenase [Verticiella sediminum]
MAASPFHMGWFLGNSYGVHGWMGQWSGSSAVNWADPSLQLDLARALDRACFDFLLMEDSVFVPDNYGSSMDLYLKRAMRAPKNDPLPLVPLLAQATRHLGIVPTISTSFYPPYLLARLMATLDLMSEGRVGCNFVTSTAARAAQNFGLDEHIEHDTRYEMADEFVEVVKKLWTSWDADAVVADEQNGVFADPGKVHVVNHQGRFFRSRGPLNTVQPPQGHPVLVQAGNSSQGQDFASKHMDTVLAAMGTIAEMKAFRASFLSRLEQAGRDPASCKIMFICTPTVAETQEEAQMRYRAAQARKDPVNVLAQMGSLVDIDFSRFDLDAPLQELTTNGQQGTFKRFLSVGRTLREVTQNYRYSYEDLVGTPDQVAGMMAEVMEEVGGDGFMITGEVNRRFIAEMADGLTPALQRRGLVRKHYTHKHFRDNLLEF